MLRSGDFCMDDNNNNVKTNALLLTHAHRVISFKSQLQTEAKLGVDRYTLYISGPSFANTRVVTLPLLSSHSRRVPNVVIFSQQ